MGKIRLFKKIFLLIFILSIIISCEKEETPISYFNIEKIEVDSTGDFLEMKCKCNAYVSGVLVEINGNTYQSTVNHSAFIYYVTVPITDLKRNHTYKIEKVKAYNSNSSLSNICVDGLEFKRDAAKPEISQIKVLDTTDVGCTIEFVVNDGGIPILSKDFVVTNSDGITIDTLNNNVQISEEDGIAHYKVNVEISKYGNDFGITAFISNKIDTCNSEILNFITEFDNAEFKNFSVSNVQTNSAKCLGGISAYYDYRFYIKKGMKILFIREKKRISADSIYNNKLSCGFFYSHTNPTPSLNSKTIELKYEKNSEFSAVLPELNPGLKYYVRAYVKTDKRTFCSNVREFVTKGLSVNTKVTLNTDKNITCTGVIANVDSVKVDSYGFCYSTTKEEPDITDSFFVAEGSFSKNIDLCPGTKYYIRAYAVNEYGTFYGNVKVVKTEDIPVETSASEAEVTATTIKSHGTISSVDSVHTEAHGFCFSSTNKTPTKDDTFTETKGSVSKFSETLKNLIPNTTYYVRAYVTTKYGTHYGDVESVTTKSISVSTYFSYLGVRATNIECSGTVNTDNSLVETHGFCYSTTNEAPTKEDAFTETKESVSNFSETLNGLTPCTKYYVRAYVTTKYGTHYGDVKTAKTKCIVTIDYNYYNNTITRIYARGYIDDAYVSAVESYGFCYSKTNNEPVKNDLFTETSGVKQTFSEYIKNLEPDTKYYIRAYVTIDGTVFYGNTLERTTESFTTTVSVESATSALAFTDRSLSDADWDSYGLCYSKTNKVPTKNDLFVERTSSYNGGSLTIGNLTPSTIYYMRAYIERGGRIFYGDVKEVKTKDPVVISLNSSSLTATSITCTGTVNLESIDSYGFCYSETNTMPNISDLKTKNVGDVESFKETLTNLRSGTLYYVRAYVKVEEQVYYGGVITVKTLQ